MDKETLDVLDRQTPEILALWENVLNGFEWVDELPNPEPPYYIHNGRRNELIDIIINRVGKRLTLWMWNRERMTEKEFNDFWRGVYEGDEEALKREEDRIERKFREQYVSLPCD